MGRCFERTRWGLLLVVLLGTEVFSSQGWKAEMHAQEGVPYAVPLVWPKVVVDVTLSTKAEKRMEAGRETLRVFGDYYGVPKPGAMRKYVSEDGQVELGSFDFEFPLGTSAKIEGVRADRIAFEQTEGKVPMLLINVVSGRKSSKNNLLACGIFQDQISKIHDGRIPITCKLIGE